jgi:hypothetical protein
MCVSPGEYLSPNAQDIPDPEMLIMQITSPVDAKTHGEKANGLQTITLLY